MKPKTNIDVAQALKSRSIPVLKTVPRAEDMWWRYSSTLFLSSALTGGLQSIPCPNCFATGERKFFIHRTGRLVGPRAARANPASFIFHFKSRDTLPCFMYIYFLFQRINRFHLRVVHMVAATITTGLQMRCDNFNERHLII